MTAAGHTFVTVPRWIAKSAGQVDVPATLSMLVPNPYSGDPKSALLQPYPSWAMNKVGDPNALQSVLGIEVDPTTNYLWVLDQGLQVPPLVNPPTSGFIKLVVINIANSQIVRTHNFDANIAPTTSFFNDLVIDVARKVAYITDSGINVPADPSKPAVGAIIVYNYNTDTARRFLSGATSTADDHSVTVRVNGQRALLASRMRTGADGIALSTDLATLYFCPLTSRTMWSVPTRVLLDPASTQADAQNAVSNLGNKISASDGLAMDSNGVLYMSMIEDNAVGRFDRTTHSVTTLVSDVQTMVWPDTFGFDHKGSIVFVTNRLNSFLDRTLVYTNESVYNFHIWSLYLGAGVGAYTDNAPDLSNRDNGLKLAFPIAMAVIICTGIVALLGYMLRKHRRSLAGDLEYMTEGYASAPPLGGYGGDIGPKHAGDRDYHSDNTGHFTSHGGSDGWAGVGYQPPTSTGGSQYVSLNHDDNDNNGSGNDNDGGDEFH
jgi:sugar lactone lactonase YvrE